MEPTTTPPNPEQAAGRAYRTPQPWLTVFQNGYAPQLADSELILLRNGLANDDPRLIQGHTTYPPPLLCIQDWPCEKADAIGFIAMRVFENKAKNIGQWMRDVATVGEVEKFFAEKCYGCDRILGEPHACRVWLNFWDDTPKDVAYRNLIAAIDGVLERRMTNEDRVNAELAAEAEQICYCGLGIEAHTYPGAAEHNFTPMPEYKPADESNATCPLCNLPLDGENGFHLACTKREQMAADLMP